MPDVVQLGRKVKNKYPGVYDDLPDGVVGQKVKAKYPGAYDDFTDTTYTPPPPEAPGILGNLSTGFKQLGQKVSDVGASAYEIGREALHGNFAPLKETAEITGRATLPYLAGAANSRGPGAAFTGMSAAQAPAIEAVKQRQTARREASGDVYFRGSAIENAKLAAEAAKDPSLLGKLTRGAPQVLPYIGAGVATGGSGAAMAATGALMELNAPENIPLAAGLAAVPIPVGQAFKASVNAVRRTFGKGAAQIIEAEAGGVALPPASGAVSPGVQRAMSQFEQEVARIKTLPPAQQAAEMEAAIQRVSSEASGVRPVSAETRAGYPPLMEFPENPNAIQMAGRLPGETAAPGASIRPFQEAKTASMPVHSLKPGDIIEYEVGVPPRTVQGEVARVQFDPDLETMVPVVKAGNAEMAAVEYLDGGRVVNQATMRGPSNVAAMDTAPPRLSAEFGPPQFGVKAAPDLGYTETVGPSVSAPINLDAALTEAAESIPRPRAERIKDEFLGTLGAFKSIKSMGDISAVLRQGGILFLRPFQAKQSAKALGQMFRAFKEKNYTAIHEAIAAHPDLPVMQEAGLYLGGPSGAIQKGEEAFIKRSGSWVGEKVGKAPGVKQSDQMYVTMLDSQRVQRFQQFKQAIDKLGLSSEEAMKGYKAAAQWVNIATGRGSLGQTIDKAFEALNYTIFSPRYVASRLNILNLPMYIKNGMTPAGRAVLRGQMADLVQYLGVVGATMYAAKQAGADVTLNPHDRDFGKIKLGTWRYDLGAGLTQALKMTYLVGEDMVRAGKYFVGKGEPPGRNDAIDVAQTFLSYKLSPPAQVFKNFVEGRTIDKKRYTPGQAAVDLAAPMQWADFVDAYQKEGLAGIGKASFGTTGIGVQNFEQTPVEAAIERAQPLFTELKRLGKQVSDLRKTTKQEFKNGKWVQVENEDDASFNRRVQQFGQNYTLYGLQLLDSPRFRQAPDSVKVLALDALNERAKQLTKAEFPFPELQLDANTLMDSAEATAAKRTK